MLTPAHRDRLDKMLDTPVGFALLVMLIAFCTGAVVTTLIAAMAAGIVLVKVVVCSISSLLC